MRNASKRGIVCLLALCSFLKLFGGSLRVASDTSPQDCILIIEGPRNSSILVATDMIHNERPIWQAVNETGGFDTLFFYWHKEDSIWILNKKVEAAAIRDIYGSPKNAGDLCPDDGMKMFYWNDISEQHEDRGRLYVAASDLWTTCRPLENTKIDSTTAGPRGLGVVDGLVECGRKAVADDASTTAVMKHGTQCFAYRSTDITTEVVIPELVPKLTYLGCIIGVVLLPGKPIARSISTVVTPDLILDAKDCAPLVRQQFPEATGMTYNSEKKTCYGADLMKGVNFFSPDTKGWYSAFLIPQATDQPSSSESPQSTTTAEQPSSTESQQTATTAEQPSSTESPQTATTASGVMPTTTAMAKSTTDGSSSSESVSSTAAGSTASVSDNTDSAGHHGGVSTGIIVGAVLGGAGGLAILVGGGYAVYAATSSSTTEVEHQATTEAGPEPVQLAFEREITCEQQFA